MDEKSFSELGHDMNNAVQDALKSGDFSRLKYTINATVQEAVTKTVNTVNDKVSHYCGPYNPCGQQPPPQTGAPPKPQPPPPPRPPAQPFQAQPRPRPVPVPPKPVNTISMRNQMLIKRNSSLSVSGTLMMVFGILGALSVGVTALVLVIVGLASSLGTMALVGGGLLMFAALFLVLTGRGSSLYNRSRRYKQYWKTMGANTYCTIQSLAAAVRKPYDYVLKELQRLIDEGMIPEGHIDDQKTCLMIGEDTYRQYLDALASMKQREQEKAAAEKEPEGIHAVVLEGRDCIRQIRAANDALPEQKISQKLDRLEMITTKIFAYVEQRPKKLPEIRRFMNYYMPTTLKLVNSYKDFDSQPVQGENIVKAKTEILEILDTINSAFETLFDSLYQDDAFDVSTDISVLKSMLAREGLTEKDFKDFKADEPELKL